MSMGTKFELEYPFNKDWKFGYLVTNSENRRNVILYNSPKDRSTVAYARYLLSVEMGRYLTQDEQVDHIDDDKTNDAIENLQILTPNANHRKEMVRRGGAKWVIYSCAKCHSRFLRQYHNSSLTSCKKGKVVYCSRACQRADVSNLFKMDMELKAFVSEEQVFGIVNKLPQSL